jgi:hypothetical protein
MRRAFSHRPGNNQGNHTMTHDDSLLTSSSQSAIRFFHTLVAAIVIVLAAKSVLSRSLDRVLAVGVVFMVVVTFTAMHMAPSSLRTRVAHALMGQ